MSTIQGKQIAELKGEPVGNPYKAAEVVGGENANNSLVASEAQRSMIEVMTQFEVAKRFPRDPVTASDKILRECERPTLAALAVYSFPMGGTKVEGPTIRLMEAIARAWGNIRFGWKVIDANKQRSIIRAFAFDLEANIDRSTEFEVKHWIDTKGGGRPCRDEREQNMLVASQAMRRVRSCLEAMIPRDVIDMATDKCEETSKKNVDCSPEGIKKVLAAFEVYGVNKAMIEARQGGLKVDGMKAPQILALRKVYASLADGMAKVEDFFDLALADKGAAKPEQPDLKAEVTAKKPAIKEKIAAAEAKLNLQPAACKNCAGKGVVEWQENGQEGTGPCPDCNGEGKV